MIKKLLYPLLFLISVPIGFCKAQVPANPYKAPLYWDVYENNFVKEKAGVSDNYISEEEWLANINWVDKNLKQHGYNMICIDGWGDQDYNQYGYRTKHSHAWKHDYAWWSDELQKRGMTLGIYDEPLWVNVAAANAGIKVKGTDIPLSTLINKNEGAMWFTWLQVDKPGAEEYVKGYVQHYADMGVKYLRVDFLSWFESGYDRNIGTVGPNRPVAYYDKALKWMREACDANGMFLSLVMPNLYNDAATELKYGHMIRINEDCAEGGWGRFSDNARGQQRAGWSQFANPFDGFIYFSKISGRGKMILDGDFIRLNTYANDDERRSVISLHLMAGGPLTISDQFNTIGSSIKFYQNEEMLELNKDGFVGSPLSNDPNNSKSQIWKGQMSNGDWIIALFNRENAMVNRSINFQTELGLGGNAFVRDLWSHTDLGTMNGISKNIPAHGCMVFRISSNPEKVLSPTFNQVEGSYKNKINLSIASLTTGALIYYTTDGSEPGISSMKYSQTFEINNTSVIKALAVKEGMVDSYISSSEYLIGESKAQFAMYVAGTFNDWNLSQVELHNTGGNNWESDAIWIEKGDQELKFANSPRWYGDDWGNSSGMSGTLELTTGGAPNVRFTAPETGNYIFRFNDYTLEYSITKTFGSTQDQMYVAGTFSSWNLSANPMNLIGDNQWSTNPILISAGNHELKFANKSDWTGDDWGNNTGHSGVAKQSTGGDPNIKFNISESKDYVFTFNDQTLAYNISSTTNITDLRSENIKLRTDNLSNTIQIYANTLITGIYCYNDKGMLLYQSSPNKKSENIDLNILKMVQLSIIKTITDKETKTFKILIKQS